MRTDSPLTLSETPRRVAGGIPAETTSYLYDAVGRLEQAAFPSGIQRRYCCRYAGPSLLSSTTSFLYYSGHGDLAAEADSSGTRTAVTCSPAELTG